MEKERIIMALNELRTMGKIEFSSHDFIKKYASNAEHEYIGMLWNKRDTTNPFQTVHSQMARELEKLQEEMGIIKTIRSESENIFGKKDVIQYWRFV